MVNHTPHKLTKYKVGSIREIWYISFPLMLSSMSGTLMFFLDRLILASYSTSALDAVVATGMPCFLFHFGAIAIASIAEVFVGQYNGSKQFDKLAQPTWQMIWFCLATFSIFLPLAFWGDTLLVPIEYQESGKYYYRLIMASGPLFALSSAISAFFIGKGTVKIVTYCVIIGNITNFILDIILIFGIEGFLNPLGIEGAAIATIIAQLLQVLILFTVFLSKNNRIKYKTNILSFNGKLLKSCLKVGWPNSIGHMLEIGAWTAVMHILARAGEDYITVFAVSQGFLVLFSFAIDGLQKGVIAVSSNLLGSKNFDLVPKVFKAAIKLHLIFIAFLIIPNFLYPDVLVKTFLYSAHNNPEIIDQTIVNAASMTLMYLWIYFIFDGIVWIAAGVLTSAGKTLFVLFANAFNAWFFVIVPLLILLQYNKLDLTTSWQVALIYGFINMLVFLSKYKSGAWKNSKII